MCFACANYHGVRDGVGYACEAYPGGIPVEIMASLWDHHEPCKSDHDIQFELRMTPTLATDPPVSPEQRHAMFAAAAGHSTLGIPKKVGEEYVGKAKDLAPEKFSVIKQALGFLKEFFTEEETEPEHEGEDAFEESKHPRNQGKFSTSSGGSNKGSGKKIDYAKYPPLAFHKDRPGTARYIVTNGTIRPYEKGDLLDSIGSLLEYKVDVKHTGTTKTTGRVEDHGDGHFVFVSDADKMQPVPYKMEGKPTLESVDKQSGFDFALKQGKKGGDFKHIQGKSDNFSDGYREGLRVLTDEPKEKVKEYLELLSGNQTQDALDPPKGRGEDEGTAHDPKTGQFTAIGTNEHRYIAHGRNGAEERVDPATKWDVHHNGEKVGTAQKFSSRQRGNIVQSARGGAKTGVGKWVHEYHGHHEASGENTGAQPSLKHVINKIAEIHNKHSGGQDEAPKGRAASLAFVTPDGKVLLVKRSDDEENFPGYWALPGGKVEDGEELEDAALREAQEEVGGGFLDSVLGIDGDCSARDCLKALDKRRTPFGWDHATFALPVKDEFEPKLNGEHSAHMWVYQDELPEKTHPGVKATFDEIPKSEDPIPTKPRVKPVVVTRDESLETRRHNEGALSQRTKEHIGREGSTQRETIPEADFLEPASKKYPVKKDGKYDRNLLLAAAREARMHGRRDLAKRADAIRTREFSAEDTPLEPAPGGWLKQVINAGSELPANMKSQNVTPPQLKRARTYNTGAQGVDKRAADAQPTDWSRFRARSRQERRVMAMDRALPSLRLARNEGYAFDRASDRQYDTDGRLHVKDSNLTKANVCPYMGREIPNWKALNLDPDKKYMLLRDPEELQKAVKTANGLPLLDRHEPATAAKHPTDLTVGSTGTNARWDAPYIKNDLSVWPEYASNAIEDGSQRELSAGYAYRADMRPGTYEGVPYDGVMRDIKFNHVALVPEGRAGTDVSVADAMPSVWSRLPSSTRSIRT